LERHESGITILEGTAFITLRGTEEPCPEGDRAFVVAKKWGNARGAKGGRKVETTNNRKKKNAPRMSSGLKSVKSNASMQTYC
jgi:hypothetical protein